MKILHSVLFCFLVQFAIGQNCKYDYNQTDLMTNNVVRRIDIKVGPKHFISLYRNGGDYFVTQTVTFVGVQHESIKAGAEFKIKLNSGEFLSFFSEQNAVPVTFKNAHDVVVTRFVIIYVCTAEDMQMIANSGFSIFSYSYGSIPTSIQLSAKNANKALTGAECILK